MTAKVYSTIVFFWSNNKCKGKEVTDSVLLLLLCDEKHVSLRYKENSAFNRANSRYTLLIQHLVVDELC